MPLPESFIQKKIMEHYENLGYYVIKLIKTSKNGIPDIVAIPKGMSDLVFIEVKTPKGVTSAIQRFRHKELDKHGCQVIVAKDWKGMLIPEEEMSPVFIPKMPDVADYDENMNWIEEGEVL